MPLSLQILSSRCWSRGHVGPANTRCEPWCARGFPHASLSLPGLARACGPWAPGPLWWTFLCLYGFGRSLNRPQGLLCFLLWVFHEAGGDFLSGTTVVSPRASGEKWWKQNPLSLSKQCWSLVLRAGKKEKKKSFQACTFRPENCVYVYVIIIKITMDHKEPLGRHEGQGVRRGTGREKGPQRSQNSLMAKLWA